MKIPLDSITIGERARKDFGNMDELQESIKNRGLINPIVVTEDYELVAGERRYRCCKNLGFREIEATLYSELSTLDRKIIELEENIHKTLDWDEQRKLRAEIHELMQEKHGKSVPGSHIDQGWSANDTAKFLGVSPATISQDLTLTKALESMPNLSKFKSKRQAIRAVDRVQELAILGELAERETKEEGKKSSSITLLNCDALTFLKESVEDETIDMVIFDPPWGISMDKEFSARGPGGQKIGYDDSEENALKLTKKMIPELFRALKDGTHMYLFFGLQMFSEIKSIVSKSGFGYREVPLIWIKESGAWTDFEYRFMPRYETILFCTKGSRRLNKASDDIFEHKRPISTSRIHSAQKDIGLLQEFIKISTVENELILDPCAGSGSTLVAAKLSRRRAIGIEKDRDSFLKADDWVKSFEI